jgi:hypothetical protein
MFYAVLIHNLTDDTVSLVACIVAPENAPVKFPENALE